MSEEKKTPEQHYRAGAAWQLEQIKVRPEGERRIMFFVRVAHGLDISIWDLDVCATEPLYGHVIPNGALGHLITSMPGDAASLPILNRAELLTLWDKLVEPQS